MKHPIPETPETLAAQLAWLAEGKRAAVLLTLGSVLPELDPRFDVVNTPHGLIVFDPARVSTHDCLRHAREGTLGELLGYGTATKPEGVATECVVIRGADGVEKQSVVVDEETKPDVLAAAHEVKDDGDTVQVEPAEQTITGRLNALQRRECVLRAYQEAEHGAAIAALHRVSPTSFEPLGVTHVVERNGVVIGWLGLNSMPFYRMSVPVEDVSANDVIGLVRVVENQLRMAGVRVTATLFDVNCRSYPYKERLGYLEMSDWRLALKQL